MNKNKSIKYMLFGISILLISVIGSAYAYFSATSSDNLVMKGLQVTHHLL